MEKGTVPDFVYQNVCSENFGYFHFSVLLYMFNKMYYPHPNFSAPDSPPQDFSVKQLSGITVKLSWQPPLEPNGIILYYTVYVW